MVRISIHERTYRVPIPLARVYVCNGPHTKSYCQKNGSAIFFFPYRKKERKNSIEVKMVEVTPKQDYATETNFRDGNHERQITRERTSKTPRGLPLNQDGGNDLSESQLLRSCQRYQQTQNKRKGNNSVNFSSQRD